MNEINSIEGPPEEGVSPVSQARKPLVNAKAFIYLGAVAILIVGVVSLLISRFNAQRQIDTAEKRAGQLAATAARAGAAPLKITANPAGAPPATGGVQAALTPSGSQTAAPAASKSTGGDIAPTGLHAAGVAPATMGASRVAGTDPLDAPVLLAPAPPLGQSTRPASPEPLEDGLSQARARLEQTRSHVEQVLQGVSAGASSSLAQGAPNLGTSGAAAAESGIKMTSTARIGAARLVAPTLTLPRGTSFSCALSSKIISEQMGPVSCVVLRNVYGSDGRVLLIERGSHLDGGYQAQVRVGASRISVAWERLRMPSGVVVDLTSPSTGPLGEAGVGGFVDHHWADRIGGALLLSFIDDAVKIEIAREQAKGSASGTLVLQGSGSQTSTLSGKVLDATINIPPTIVKNQGEIVAVNVAHDVDFSTVYELRPSALVAGQ